MDWTAVSAMSEAIGALAVVISLIYVALQVRQNTASTKSTVETEIALALGNAGLNAAHSGMGAVFVRCLTEPDAATGEERGNFFVWMIGYFRIFQLAFDQHRAGNLSNASWESIEAGIKFLMEGRGAAQFWSARRSIFPTAFRNYVDAVKPHELSATAVSETMAFVAGEKR
jgi:hypothetical protein